MRFTAACSEEQRLTHGCAAIWGHAKVRLCLATNWPWRTRRTIGDNMFTASLFSVSSYSDVVVIYTINSIHVGLWSISVWVESLFCHIFYSFFCPCDYVTKLVPSSVPCLCSVSYCMHNPRYTTPTPVSSLTLSRLHPALAGPIPSITSFTFLVFLPLSFSPRLIYKSPCGALLFSPSSALRHDCRSSFTHLFLSLHLPVLSLLPPFSQQSSRISLFSSG